MDYPLPRPAGKKILILYTSVGLGHKSIAENIGWYFQKAGHAVEFGDMRTVEKGRFERIVVAVHQFINRRFPFVWGWLYRFGHFPVLPFRVAIAGFNYKKTKALVDAVKPDVIITTQTSASAVVAYLRQSGLYKNRFGIAFSDYHLHPYWLYRQADFYLANIEEQKQLMARQGTAPEKIFVVGMTLPPKPAVDPAAVREKLGIAPNERVVLVGTGSLGIGFKEQDVQDLSRLPNARIVFACGKNTSLLEHLNTVRYPHVLPLGFYSPMAELYAIADIFVGKPGGLSTAEALQWRLPLLITFTLPGQEELNVGYLARRRLVMVREGQLADQVERELSTRSFRKQLAHNPFVAEVIGRTEALEEAILKVS